MNGSRAPNDARDFNTQSLSREVHGRITPRIQETAHTFAPIDGAAVTTNLWGVRWSKLGVHGMRNGVSAVTGMAVTSATPIPRSVAGNSLGGERSGWARARLDLEHIRGLRRICYLPPPRRREALVTSRRHMQSGTAPRLAATADALNGAGHSKRRRTEIGEINGLMPGKLQESR